MSKAEALCYQNTGTGVAIEIKHSANAAKSQRHIAS